MPEPYLTHRLRDAAEWVEHQEEPAPDWDGLLREAADEIESLRELVDGSRMVLPVRVPVDAPIHRLDAGTISDDHPLAFRPCPVCCQPLHGSRPVVLVYVGMRPEDRRPSGWARGFAVAVHADEVAGR